jgi:Uma2 family endonuclease
MLAPATTRPFEPGTVGWSVEDLEDPATLELWREGRYEIVCGVLARIPAAYFEHGSPNAKLIALLDRHFESRGEEVRIASEVDLVVAPDLVLVADVVMMTRENHARQLRNSTSGHEGSIGRLTLPPTLVIESASRGHERHDYEFKRERYAAFGIPHYWIAHHADRSLLCLRLHEGRYLTDAQASGPDAVVQPPAFPGLLLPLGKVFM